MEPDPLSGKGRKLKPKVGNIGNPVSLSPLNNRCQIVWTNPHGEAKKLQEMPEAEFIKKLEAYTGGLLGKLELVSPRALFPVQLMQSDTYVKPRLALIGDAAHCCHPVGGQGLNLGIRDASENLAILGFTDFLDRLFSNNWPPIVVIRRLGLAMMRGFPPLKLFALQLMTGLKGRIPQLAR